MKRGDVKLIRLAVYLHSGAALSIMVTGVFGAVFLRRLSQLVDEAKQLLEAVEVKG